ncbi:MAG TPA: SAM-dependent methyltransferase [Acetobacteraceae bacterium]|nr:SAM-dependent methyltransferase [Acetobacteraceae bacterium]
MIAYIRAQESLRPDALFHDPLAALLHGAEGAAIARRMGRAPVLPLIVRTWLFDRMIEDAVAAGADTVLNLAAGLDTRPYRMALPAGLRWIEIDLPDLMAEKSAALADATPSCRLERIPLDLGDTAARQTAFTRIGASANRVLVVSEGFLSYLPADEVAALARDLAAPPAFQTWLLELNSPGVLRAMQKRYATELKAAPMHFAPAEGPGFFIPHGWAPVEVRSFLRTAVQLGRAGMLMRLLARRPESSGAQGARFWTGACRFMRKE